MSYARLPEEIRGGIGRWFDLQFPLSNIGPLRDYQEEAEAAWLAKSAASSSCQQAREKLKSRFR